MLSFIVALACTKAGDVPSDSGVVEDTDDSAEPVSYPSSYESGKYRAESLVIVEDLEGGGDVDGDGDTENKLPQVLVLVDIATTQDLGADDINATLEADIDDGTIVVLSELAYAEGSLTQDILLGSLDESEAIVVDPMSYDDAGVPNSRLSGIFQDETTYRTKADRILLPFPIQADEPPFLVPLEMVVIEGTVTDETVTGFMYGAVPVDDLIDDIVDPITPTGDDYDPADFQDMERDEFLQYLRELGNDENVSDIELSDGRRAVSAALTFEANAADW